MSDRDDYDYERLDYDYEGSPRGSRSRSRSPPRGPSRSRARSSSSSSSSEPQDTDDSSSRSRSRSPLRRRSRSRSPSPAASESSAECDICGREFTHHNHEANKHNYNQHLEAHYRRGEGLENGVEIECKICGKTFYDSRGNFKHVENMRKQHMKVHEPRSILCPIAQDKMFKSVADAVKHVESGACKMCPGKENARKAIFDFLKKNSLARNFMDNMLENDGDYGRDDVPDYPYKCNQCLKKFKNLSSLMQHQADSSRCDDASSRLGKVKLH